MTEPETRAFYRRMARQHIGYWRECKATGLPVTAAWARRVALAYLVAARRGEVV